LRKTHRTTVSVRAYGRDHSIVIRIRVRNTHLVDDLVEALHNAECAAVVLDAHTCGVTFPDDADDRQFAAEIRFFLRAWQRRHDDADVLLLA
jgi:hypothetical protein